MRRVERWALLVVIVGSMVLAARLAFSDPLWLDELTSYWFSAGDGMRSVIERMIDRSDPHPPGYQLALYLWLQLPGAASSAGAARLSSVLAFGVAIVAGSVLAERITGKRRAALFFATVYASLAFVPFYASELRSYMSLQAAFLVVLLCRDLRSSEAAASRRAILLGVESLAALALATFHYVGTIFVAALLALDLALAFRGPIFSRDGKWFAAARRSMVSWPYLAGALVATAWLVLPSRPAAYRALEATGVRMLARCFLEAFGKPQLVVLTLLVLWFSVRVCTGGRWAASRSRYASVALRSGLAVSMLAFVLLIALSFFKPMIQTRNVLLVVPPFVIFMSVVLATEAGARVVFPLLLVFPFLAASGYLQELEPDERHHENFGALALAVQGKPTVCRSDDVAQKLRDAYWLATGEPLRSDIYALRKGLGTGAARPVEEFEPKRGFFFLCVHCNPERLQEFRKSVDELGFARCVRREVLGKEKLWWCRESKKRKSHVVRAEAERGNDAARRDASDEATPQDAASDAAARDANSDAAVRDEMDGDVVEAER